MKGDSGKHCKEARCGKWDSSSLQGGDERIIRITKETGLQREGGFEVTGTNLERRATHRKEP